MHAQRLRARVPMAEALEPARLADHRLAFDKLGRDGSGKCNVHPERNDEVLGVVFRVSPLAGEILDGIEGAGYKRVSSQVVGLNSGDPHRVFYYQAHAHAVSTDVLPFDWYHRFVVDGARMHGLPPHWIELLKAVATVSDANSSGGADLFRDVDHKPVGRPGI